VVEELAVEDGQIKKQMVESKSRVKEIKLSEVEFEYLKIFIEGKFFFHLSSNGYFTIFGELLLL